MSVPGQGRALLLIATAQLLALALWFSASAVADSLGDAWGIADGDLYLLTIPVQVGFVIGAVASAATNLADRVPSRRLFSVSALAGAAANAVLIALGRGDLVLILGLRFLTGVALAGVYPSGMKAIAGWFVERRGTALGILIGALTLGSALPHLVRGVGLDWQLVLAAASVLGVVGAGLMMLAGDGPFETQTSAFSWAHLRSVIDNRGFRLATVGYLGHMWELYAMWTWIAAYIAATEYEGSASLATFVVIAAGAPGSWLAGSIADRNGRTLAAGGAMVLSGSAAALTAIVFDAPVAAMLVVLVVWGFTIVADSAQFSAMVTEVVPPEVRGTALTLQTALGFTLTLVTIWLVPQIAEATSWQWAFLVLVPGPVVGTVAMARLRASDWADSLAGGQG